MFYLFKVFYIVRLFKSVISLRLMNKKKYFKHKKRRLKSRKNLCTENFTCMKKFYVHEIAAEVTQSLTATMFLRNIFICMMSGLVATLCGICLQEWFASFMQSCKKKVLINLRNFSQIVLLVVETSSQTNKRCSFFIGTFS